MYHVLILARMRRRDEKAKKDQANAQADIRLNDSWAGTRSVFYVRGSR
jgi:hypothetical protein